MAILDGEKVRLWCDAEGVAYASVLVSGHWENYRIDEDSELKLWMRHEYSERYSQQIEGKCIRAVLSANALTEALNHAAAEAHARSRSLGDVQITPRLRVGGSVRDGEVGSTWGGRIGSSSR